MFGRICAIATLLPALLAAQEGTGYHPYLRADLGFGRYMEVDVADEDLDVIEDDLKSPIELSFAGGVMGPQKIIGFGLVLQADAAVAKARSTSDDTEVEATLSSGLFGAQMLLRREITPTIAFRGELGLAMAVATQEMEMTGTVSTGTSAVPASVKMTIESEGVALLAAGGLDFQLTPRFSLGVMLNLVSGSATPESATMEMKANGESETRTADSEDLDELDDQDISSIALTGGVRFLF